MTRLEFLKVAVLTPLIVTGVVSLNLLQPAAVEAATLTPNPHFDPWQEGTAIPPKYWGAICDHDHDGVNSKELDLLLEIKTDEKTDAD